MDDIADSALGKPVSSVKTAITKIVGGLSVFYSAITVAVGVGCLVSGRNAEQFLPHYSNQTVGLINIGAGAIEGLIGKAMWDSASSAGRTRNYLELKRQIDQVETLKAKNGVGV